MHIYETIVLQLLGSSTNMNGWLIFDIIYYQGDKILNIFNLPKYLNWNVKLMFHENTFGNDPQPNLL